MIYIGIDPGHKGGYAIISDEGEVKVAPWDDSQFVMCMRGISAYAHENNVLMIAALEKVGAMPGQGTVSMFNFGKSAGFIEGVLTAFGIPYQLVTPVRWKREFGLNSDKAKSIEVCKRLFPGVDLIPTERSRKESDGMAESLLLSLYAQRCL